MYIIVVRTISNICFLIKLYVYHSILTYSYNFIDTYTLFAIKMYGVLSIVQGRENDVPLLKHDVRRLYFVSIMITLYIELLYTK